MNTVAENVRLRMNTLGKLEEPFLFVIDFEMEKPFVMTRPEMEKTALRFQMPNDSVHNSKAPMKKCDNIEWVCKPEPMILYATAFDFVQSEINAGNSYLANLTRKTPIQTNVSLSQIYELSHAQYKLLIPGHCVVFSPESFVNIKDQKIWSYPMKGTIDASIPNAAWKLRNNPKERAEHATIVDLIRNDLSRVSSNVRVDAFQEIMRIDTNQKSLLQMSSTISGRLKPDYLSHLGDIMFDLLPAGSVSGAPKKKTIEIIETAEGEKRGFYTGVMGYFDGQSLDSAVMIRYIEEEDNQKYFRSGGGITAQSNVEYEYQETLDKIYVPIYREHKTTQGEVLEASLSSR